MTDKAGNYENVQINMQNMDNDAALQIKGDPYNKLEIETENFFPITVNQIDKIFESYMKGNRETEIQEITSHGGLEGLLQKVKTEKETGLQGNEEPNEYIRPQDELERIKQFLDNVKIEAPLQVRLYFY